MALSSILRTLRQASQQFLPILAQVPSTAFTWIGFVVTHHSFPQNQIETFGVNAVFSTEVHSACLLLPVLRVMPELIRIRRCLGRYWQFGGSQSCWHARLISPRPRLTAENFRHGRLDRIV